MDQASFTESIHSVLFNPFGFAFADGSGIIEAFHFQPSAESEIETFQITICDIQLLCSHVQLLLSDVQTPLSHVRPVEQTTEDRRLQDEEENEHQRQQQRDLKDRRR
jgi:hypothetical protein